MLKEKFYQATNELFQKVRETQDCAIKQAAQIVADAVEKGANIHLFDTGHIIDSEIINRAGGFVLLKKFKYGITVESPTRIRNDMEKDKSLAGLAALALKAGNVYPGDVMFIGSVSGKSENVIDLALACQEYGVTTIGISSHEYSSQLESLHPSNKRLYEIVDLAIDNCAPHGDGMLSVEGIEKSFIPASGLAAAYIMWAMNAVLLELLLEKGITPGIYGSINYPGNREYNEKLEKTYQEKGY